MKSLLFNRRYTSPAFRHRSVPQSIHDASLGADQFNLGKQPPPPPGEEEEYESRAVRSGKAWCKTVADRLRRAVIGWLLRRAVVGCCRVAQLLPSHLPQPPLHAMMLRHRLLIVALRRRRVARLLPSHLPPPPPPLHAMNLSRRRPLIVASRRRANAATTSAAAVTVVIATAIAAAAATVAVAS